MAACLENLPAEIFAHIVCQIRADRSSCAFLAATSRQCQVHVEALTFKSLSITPQQLPEFERIVHRERFRRLRVVRYDARSAGRPEDDTPTLRIESSVLDACSEAFSKAIRDMLVALNRKDEQDGDYQHPGVSLVLATAQGLQNGNVHDTHFDIFVAPPPAVRDDDAAVADPISFDKAWLRLLPDMFPRNLVAPIVTSLSDSGLTVHEGELWSIWLASWSATLFHLPNVTNVELNLVDRECKSMTSRRRARDSRYNISCPVLD